jgi:hypothetical protein
MAGMNWPQSKLSHFWISIIIALIVAGFVFHHLKLAHYRFYMTEVASPGEVIPSIDPAEAWGMTLFTVAPLCYMAQRISTAASRRREK